MLPIKLGSEGYSNGAENLVVLPHPSKVGTGAFRELEPYAQDHSGEDAQHRKSLSGAEGSTNRFLSEASK
jgi:hypothetical protein